MTVERDTGTDPETPADAGMAADESGAAGSAPGAATGGGGSGAGTDGRVEIDLVRVRAEIDEEVRLRRASGDFPVTLDRELDDLFESLAPGVAGSDELGELIDRAEEAAFVDVDVPTASRIPGGSLVKRLIAKIITWYATHLARQTTTFATAASRSLRLVLRRVVDVEARVRALEDAPAAARARLAAEPRPPRELLDAAEWSDVVLGALAGRRGRVLHADAGRGTLVGLLGERGIDAYGIEPDEPAAAEAADAHVEVRFDDTLRHLRRLPAQAIDGLVLSGCVDRLPAVELLDVADEAARVLRPGAPLVLISSTQAAWGRELGPVESDLSPGRPFHPETWTGLLAARRFTGVEAHTDRPASYAITARLGDGPPGAP